MNLVRRLDMQGQTERSPSFHSSRIHSAVVRTRKRSTVPSFHAPWVSTILPRGIETSCYLASLPNTTIQASCRGTSQPSRQYISERTTTVNTRKNHADLSA